MLESLDSENHQEKVDVPWRLERKDDVAEAVESAVDCVDIERDGGRDMRRRVSSEERCGGELLRTIGGSWIPEVEALSSGDVATASGGESEDVGRVERVRLSKNGGGRARFRPRKVDGNRAIGGRAISGSCSASRRRVRLGDEDNGEDEPDSEPERLCWPGDQFESQRRTGALCGAAFERSTEGGRRISEGLSRDERGLSWGVDWFDGLTREPRRASRRSVRRRRDEGRDVGGSVIGVCPYGVHPVSS